MSLEGSAARQNLKVEMVFWPESLCCKQSTQQRPKSAGPRKGAASVYLGSYAECLHKPHQLY